MERKSKKEFEKIRKERICDIGKCELCGSKKGLELHHIIPYSLGGTDSESNLLLICEKCHYLLTPKSELSRLGIARAKLPTSSKIDFYNLIEENQCVTAVEVLDIFDIWHKKYFETR